MFRAFSPHHQELNDCSGSLWFYLRIVVIAVLCSWSGQPARPRTQHCCHHDTKVKPEAATAVIEHLMIGGKTPETCWAVNKRQDNIPKNCCIWLVIYLNCTMMHGLSNFKWIIWCTVETALCNWKLNLRIFCASLHCKVKVVRFNKDVRPCSAVTCSNMWVPALGPSSLRLTCRDVRVVEGVEAFCRHSNSLYSTAWAECCFC